MLGLMCRNYPSGMNAMDLNILLLGLIFKILGTMTVNLSDL